MFKGLRRHLTYANITATAAVVFAMSGGAYALGNIRSEPQSPLSPRLTASAAKAKKVKKRSKSLVGARGPAGPRGSTGPVGATGPQGLQGPQGEKGAQGEKGVTGSTGKEGAQGEQGPAGPQGSIGPKGNSVTSKAFEGKQGECEAGGSEFKVGGVTTYACNGSGGSGGSGGTLAQGKTEMGVWSVVTNASDTTYDFEHQGSVPITFAIPLANEKKELTVEYAGEEKTANCPGRGGRPEAKEGYFCIYVSNENGITFFTESGVKPFGLFLHFTGTSASSYAEGSWAATAGEPAEEE